MYLQENILLDNYNNIWQLRFEIYLQLCVLSDNGNRPGGRVTETGILWYVENKTEKDAGYHVDSMLDRISSCGEFSEYVSILWLK